MNLGAIYVTETKIGTFAYTWDDRNKPPLFARADGSWDRSIAHARIYPSTYDVSRHFLWVAYSDLSQDAAVVAFGSTLRDYASTFVDSFNDRLKVETQEARRILEL